MAGCSSLKRLRFLIFAFPSQSFACGIDEGLPHPSLLGWLKSPWVGPLQPAAAKAEAAFLLSAS